jgi:hypothetical protein
LEFVIILTESKRPHGWSTRPKAKHYWYCPSCRTAKLLTLYVRAERWTKPKVTTNPLTDAVRTKRNQRWVPIGTVCTACRFPVVFDNRVPRRPRPDDLTTVEKSTRWIGQRGQKRRANRYDYAKGRRAMERFYGAWTQEDFESGAEASKKHWQLYSEALDLYLGMTGPPF